jgi:hypothetical protein
MRMDEVLAVRVPKGFRRTLEKQRRRWPMGAALSVVLLGSVAAQDVVRWQDPSPHATRLVTVEPDVQVEVLEWAGTGRPLVLLAGAGHTAHVFDGFAQRRGAPGWTHRGAKGHQRE